MTNQLDRKDLKIQALLEKISQLTTQYESQSADSRVEITLLVNDNQEKVQRIGELEGQLAEYETSANVPTEENDSSE